MLEGVLAGIETGWFQQLIAEAAFEEQRRLESGDLVKVGVNAFVDPDAGSVDTLVIGPEAEAGQRESVARTRSSRDAAAADGALDTASCRRGHRRRRADRAARRVRASPMHRG